VALPLNQGAASASWSGSVSASAQQSFGYGYSISQTFSSTTGWSNASGSSWGTASGWSKSSFSASSPFATSFSGTTQSLSVSGVVNGSGSDWSNYSYKETETLGSDGVTWSVPSGSGSASGGSSANWSYGGTGSGSNPATGTYSLAADGGSVSGSVSEWGQQSDSLGYHTSATLIAETTSWSQTGAGSAAASASFGYSYSGSGNGTTPSWEYGSWPTGTTWSMSNEHGSLSESASFSQPLTYDGDWEGTGSLSASGTQEDYYKYHFGSTVTGSNNSTVTSGDITDDEITNTQSTTPLGGNASASFAGSGSASTTVTYTGPSSDTSYVAENGASWFPYGGGSLTQQTTWTSDSGGQNSIYPGTSSTSSSGSPAASFPNLFGETGGPGPAPSAEVPVVLHNDGLATWGGLSAGGGPNLGPGPVPAGSDFAYFFGSPTALPSSTSLLSTSGPNAAVSLVGLAPSPTIVDAVWGMNFTAQAGQLPLSVTDSTTHLSSWTTSYTAAAAPQTAFAAGNLNVGSLSTNSIVGASATFRMDTAPAVPVTVASLVDIYGVRDVSAGAGAKGAAGPTGEAGPSGPAGDSTGR
jgi:hypothetical protein